jgi:hypothetical protein
MSRKSKIAELTKKLMKYGDIKYLANLQIIL